MYRQDAGATKTKIPLPPGSVEGSRMGLAAHLWRQGKTSKAGADMEGDIFLTNWVFSGHSPRIEG